MTVKDVKHLVEYWIEGSDYDWSTALSLFRSKKYPYALFMCHLAIEKLLKGLFVKETKDHAPYTHNLAFLAGKLPLEFTKEQIVLLEAMNEFNLEARYPDEKREFYKRVTRDYAKRYQESAGVLRQWLKSKL